MDFFRKSTVCFGLIVMSLGVVFSNSSAFAESPTIEFRDGDRVVLLGSAFVERLQADDYLETYLTANLDKRVTFRNLGWSGDDVWGTARAVFGTQADGFKRLIDDVKLAKPTVILVAYGANEANQGEAALPTFVKGLNRLLDHLEKTEARLALVSTPPRERIGSPLPDPAEYNAHLRTYAMAIERIAQKRHLAYLDFTNRLLTADSGVPTSASSLTDDTMHFNAYGHWLVAPKMAALLGVQQAEWKVALDFEEDAFEAAGTTIKKVDVRPDWIQFEATDHALPYSSPPDSAPQAAAEVSQQSVLQVKGLAKGTYELRIDDEPAVSASQDQWAEGVRLDRGRMTPQVEQLRVTIREKNRLFFHRYRPQNETYLFLFRKHEQGNNAAEVPQFDDLISAKDEEIAKLKTPRARTYRLIKQKGNRNAE